jgi:hypothetical protein
MSTAVFFYLFIFVLPKWAMRRKDTAGKAVYGTGDCRKQEKFLSKTGKSLFYPVVCFVETRCIASLRGAHAHNTFFDMLVYTQIRINFACFRKMNYLCSCNFKSEA